jgi:hypothetical protein
MGFLSSIFGRKPQPIAAVEFVYMKISPPAGEPFIAVFASRPYVGLLWRSLDDADLIIRERFGVTAVGEPLADGYAIESINTGRYKVVFMDRLL